MRRTVRLAEAARRSVRQSFSDGSRSGEGGHYRQSGYTDQRMAKDAVGGAMNCATTFRQRCVEIGESERS
jgi:hypothetical protein